MKLLMLLGLLFAALGATPAYAETHSLIDDGWPPASYQTQDDIQVTILFVKRSRIETLCGHLKDATVLACTLPSGTVVLPDPNGDPRYTKEAFARLVGHELGHVKGWPGDHPRP